MTQPLLPLSHSHYSFNDASPGPNLTVPSAPRGLAMATIVLSVIVTVLQAVGCVLAFGVTSAIQELKYGDELRSVLSTYDQITVAQLVAQISAGVVAILWLWRSRGIVEVVEPGAFQARSRVWVWLGWILPVVCLWFPFQVVRDVSRATRRSICDGLGWWWAWWLIFSFANNVAARVISVDTIGALPVFEVIAVISLVFALMGWIHAIRTLTAAQGLRILEYRARRTSDSGGGVGRFGRL